MLQKNKDGNAIRALSSEVSGLFDVSIGQYILRPGKSDAKSINTITQKVENRGGKVTGYLPQPNMLFVSAAREDFAGQFKSNEASVGLDFVLEAPNVKSYEVGFLDEANAPGGDNPPSIGDK